MGIPSFGGAVWRNAWAAPGEGPYTLSAKLLHANRFRTSHMQKVLRLKHPTGASLLAPEARRSTSEPYAVWGRLLQDASLASCAPRFYRHLAGDESLRYCHICMAGGFQAAVAQIDGLDQCLLHDEPLRSSCRDCGAQTPRYRVKSPDGRPRLSCSTCGTSFGGARGTGERLDAWAAPCDLSGLIPINEWLARVEDAQLLNWINLDDWHCASLNCPDPAVFRRRAIFRALLTVLPDPRITTSQQPVEIFGPYALDEDPAAAELSLAEYSEIAHKLTPARNTRRHHNGFRTPSFRVEVPVDASVPPEVHAKLLWRAQFETGATIDPFRSPPLELRSRVVSSFLGQQWNEVPFGGKQVKEGLLAAAWAASLRIARDWHDLVAQFRNEHGPRANHHWLTANSRWASHLGWWAEHRCCPVGVIFKRDSGSAGASQVFFVVA